MPKEYIEEKPMPNTSIRLTPNPKPSYVNVVMRAFISYLKTQKVGEDTLKRMSEGAEHWTLMEIVAYELWARVELTTVPAIDI